MLASSLSPSWRRDTHVNEGVEFVLWQDGNAGPSVEFVVERGQPRLDSLEVDQRVSVSDLATILTIEAQRCAGVPS